MQDDYKRAIDEYDEKVFLSFKMVLREIRNIYVSLVVVIVHHIYEVHVQYCACGYLRSSDAYSQIIHVVMINY